MFFKIFGIIILLRPGNPDCNPNPRALHSKRFRSRSFSLGFTRKWERPDSDAFVQSFSCFFYTFLWLRPGNPDCDLKPMACLIHLMQNSKSNCFLIRFHLKKSDTTWSDAFFRSFRIVLCHFSIFWNFFFSLKISLRPGNPDCHLKPMACLIHFMQKSRFRIESLSRSVALSQKLSFISYFPSFFISSCTWVWVQNVWKNTPRQRMHEVSIQPD